jgi:hypothetical protein
MIRSTITHSNWRTAFIPPSKILPPFDSRVFRPIDQHSYTAVIRNVRDLPKIRSFPHLEQLKAIHIPQGISAVDLRLAFTAAQWIETVRMYTPVSDTNVGGKYHTYHS